MAPGDPPAGNLVRQPFGAAGTWMRDVAPVEDHDAPRVCHRLPACPRAGRTLRGWTSHYDCPESAAWIFPCTVARLRASLSRRNAARYSATACVMWPRLTSTSP